MILDATYISTKKILMLSEKVFGKLCGREATGHIRLYVLVCTPNMEEYNVDQSCPFFSIF